MAVHESHHDPRISGLLVAGTDYQAPLTNPVTALNGPVIDVLVTDK